MIHALGTGLERDLYTAKLAERVGVTVEQLQRAIKPKPEPRRTQPQQQQQRQQQQAQGQRGRRKAVNDFTSSPLKSVR